MGFSMDELSKKAARFTEKAVEKTGEVANNTKIAVQVKSLEADLDDEFKALGKIYYNKLQNEECNEEESKMIARIDKLIAEIKELNDQKQ